jgi:hypothetical protein
MIKYGYINTSNIIEGQEQSNKLLSLGVSENNIFVDFCKDIELDKSNFVLNNDWFGMTFDMNHQKSLLDCLNILKFGDELHFKDWNTFSRYPYFVELIIDFAKRNKFNLVPYNALPCNNVEDKLRLMLVLLCKYDEEGDL